MFDKILQLIKLQTHKSIIKKFGVHLDKRLTWAQHIKQKRKQ